MTDTLRTGDMIVFKDNPKLFSRLVQIFTKSNVNHVAMVVKLYNRNGKGFPFIIEATQKGGVEYHYLPTVINNTKSELYAYKLTGQNLQKLDKKIDDFYTFANQQIGKDYSIPDAIETVIDKLFDKTVTKDDFDKFICSILVGAIYRNVNIITADMLKRAGFQCVSELTPVDCCNLPIFKESIKLERVLNNEQSVYVSI